MNKLIRVFSLTNEYLKRYKHLAFIHSDIRAEWANEILAFLNFKIKSQTIKARPHSTIFVANHISYIDIPLLMSSIEDSVFISKYEVSLWPLFGRASKKIGTIFVKRSSRKSRSQAREEIERQILEGSKQIVVFPSGTTSMKNEKVWRKGVFEIAHKLGIPVQPIRISYSHLREVAYIDKDFFPVHLMNLATLPEIEASVEAHPPIIIKNVSADLDYCQKWCSEPSYFSGEENKSNDHLLLETANQ